MPYQEFGGVVEVVPHGVDKLRVDYAALYFVVVVLELLAKYGRKPVLLRIALAVYVAFSGGNAYLDRSYSRAVLSAVVLLLHEEEELVESVQRIAVFFLIVLQGFEEPY